MELSVAVQMIEPGVNKTETRQTWADLGAGGGLFTKALASLIPSGLIYAIDKENSDWSEVSSNGVQVQKIRTDFIANELQIDRCDGILMANSFHYVRDKITFIARLKKLLTKTGVLIVIEYESVTGNSWVPYPIRFNDLERLMVQSGFASALKIGEAPSVYHPMKMYSALIRQF